MEFEYLAARVQPARGLIRREWHQHSNGGGWVQNSAHVDATAYIGPEALVLHGAQVLGKARVLDQACIKGAAIIEDKVVVSECARVGAFAHLSGKCKVGGTALICGKFAASSGVYKTGIYEESPTQQRASLKKVSQLSP